jgi:regulator of telomere elongation helicase 1
MDIEELHKIAQREQYCPYFANKDRCSAADLIFMPYNYLIDDKIQENFEIEYSNSILIFDEAHNVAGCAEEVSSFEIKAK